MGLRVDLAIWPVLGCTRRGEARLYTIRSCCPKCFLITSRVCFLISSENASPLILLPNKPAARASFSKATELYQPAVAVLLFSAGLSKKTPTVDAPQPKAATTLET